MGTDPLNWDSDGNGISDLADWLASRPPVITSSSYLEIQAGRWLGYGLTAECGGGSYAWSLSGDVPSGLSLWGDTLGGFVEPPGVRTFQVTVTAANGLSASQAMTVAVAEPPPAPHITSASPLPGGAAGSMYDFTFAAADGGAPYAWSITGGSLPPGLVLSSAGTLSGAPTAAGTWTLDVTVTDADGQSSAGSFPLTVEGEPPPLQIDSASFDARIGMGFSATLEASGARHPTRVPWWRAAPFRPASRWMPKGFCPARSRARPGHGRSRWR